MPSARRLGPSSQRGWSHELVQYQRELVTALVEEDEHPAVLTRLRQGIAGTRLKPYIEAFDPRMVELLAVLTSRWVAVDPARDPSR